MLRILHTGDLHLGRRYQKQEQENAAVAARCQEARLEALRHIIVLANSEHCDFVVIAGDLYDGKKIADTLQQQVCSILAGCACPVLVLPGNHDYYEGRADPLWSRFTGLAGENTLLLAQNSPVTIGHTVFYPCGCHDRHSETNALGWLAALPEHDPAYLHIGIAHGALEGLSCDREQRYYDMTVQELEHGGMDLWLLGHTHMPYPNQDNITGHRIFNAGTPQQTDIADHAAGSVFLIDIDEQKQVTARKQNTGVIRFVQAAVSVAHGTGLRDALETLLHQYDRTNTFFRVQLAGTVPAEEFLTRQTLYDELGDTCLKLEIRDEALRQEITAAMIDTETIEGTTENRLLKCYLEEPELLELAYSLVRQCKGEEYI